MQQRAHRLYDFDALTLDELRKRKSEKWSTYPHDVLPAFVAEMDFPLAPPVRAALMSAVENNDCGYAGLAELAPAFARYAAADLRWQVESADIFGVPDVMAGVAEGLQALTAPGAGVVINPPVYPPFFEVIQTIGRRLVEVPLLRSEAESEWELDFLGLEKAFAGGAQAFLLCSPHNPVGRVWPPDELQRVAALAKRYQVAVLADEIHAPLTMPGVPFTPFLSVAGELGSCLALTSASKAWNIAGLKCAIVVAGSPAMRSILQAAFDAKPTDIRWRIGHLGALASVAAFREGSAWLRDVQAYLDRNRRLLGDLLSLAIPRARYRPPQATYLAWIDCRALGLGPDPAAHFLEHGRVALEPGPKFGVQGAGFARLNIATSAAILRQIVESMADSL